MSTALESNVLSPKYSNGMCAGPHYLLVCIGWCYWNIMRKLILYGYNLSNFIWIGFQ